MTAIAIQAGFPQFADTDGTPLNSGKIYIGEVDKDPVANPLPVFFDEALTIPAAQPLDTTNGYLFYQGTPAAFYVGGSYSIKVLNKNEVTVYENPKGIVTNVTNNVENVTQYLGAASSPPTTRTDGTALQVGDIYFDTTTNLMKVYDGSSFIGFAGPYLPLVGGTMGGNIEMQDNNEVRFGASADLKIYHDGTDSYIKEAGTGDLNIEGDANINIGSAFTGSPQIVVKGIGLNGSEFYFGASKKAEITTNGLDVTGTVEFDGLSGTGSVTVTDILDEDNMGSDSATALATQQSIKAYVDTQIGANNDLSEILANGNTTGGTDISVSSGDDITFADTSKAIFGAGSDLQIYHSGTNSYIDEQGTGSLVVKGTQLKLQASTGDSYLNATQGGTVELYYNNNLKLATTSGGVDITGTCVFDGLTGVSGATITRILDEDNMGSDSDTALATQQSIKAYVDAQVGASDALSEVLVNGNTTSGTDLVISSGDTLNASAATVTAGTVDINGGAIDGTTIGAAVPAAATFTTSTSTTANITTGNITSADIDGGAIDGTSIGGSVAASGTFTDLTVNDTVATVTLNDTNTANQTATLEESNGIFTIITRNGTSPGAFDVKTTPDGTTLTRRFRVASTGDANLYATNGSTVGFKWDASTERVGIGTVSPSQALHVVGNQITSGTGQFNSGIVFGASSGNASKSSSSNTLEEYEEGTFDGGIALEDNSGHAATLPPGLQAYYTKIGRLVTCHIRMVNINTTGLVSSDPLKITGLPFNTRSSHVPVAPCYTVQVNKRTGGTDVYGVGSGNSDELPLRIVFEGGGTGALTANDLSSGSAAIYLTFSYITP